MNKLNFFGVGPKIGKVLLPWLTVTVVLFIIPALSLLLNSWLVLTSSVVGYLMLKIFISQEYRELEKFFGEEYLKYKSETPEFFPLPIKKWMKKIQRLWQTCSNCPFIDKNKPFMPFCFS